MIALFGEHDATVMVSIIGAFSVWIQLRTKRDTKQINQAVNHVGKGEPTMIARVRTLEAWQKWVTHALLLFAEHLGVALPDPPHDLHHEGKQGGKS